jgi:hypothetical protein
MECMMEKEINLRIQSISARIKRRPSNRKTIQNNYDHLFTALKNDGYNDFVAHHWPLSMLSKIYGQKAAINAVSYND